MYRLIFSNCPTAAFREEYCNTFEKGKTFTVTHTQRNWKIEIGQWQENDEYYFKINGVDVTKLPEAP